MKFERVEEPGGGGSTPVGLSGLTTRGIRVDGRVGSVDILENLLSFGQQEAILQATLDAAARVPGDRLVDVGCGSGKLAITAARALTRQASDVSGSVLGIDATPGMVEFARRSAAAARSTARFQVGIAEALPLEDGGVNAVTSSYFFHHLPSDAKRLALREMWRVLAPGGRLVITDYGRARGLKGLIASIPMRCNFYEYTRPQLGGELERLVEQELRNQAEIVQVFLGYITVLRLVKPAGR